MQKEVSIILRNRLKALPFVDVLAGNAQLLTTQDISDSDKGVTFPIEKRPVSYDVVVVKDSESKRFDDCTGREVSLVPNSSRKSIIFFEDGRMIDGKYINGLQGYELPIRLICWMNRLNLVGDAYKNIAGYCMAMIREKITAPATKSITQDAIVFRQFKVSYEGSPPQDNSIFSKYTFLEIDRQYLRPPYEFFAIDFRAVFYVDPKCLAEIDFTQKVCN